MNIFIQKEAFNSIFNSDISTYCVKTIHNTLCSGSDTTKSILNHIQEPNARKIKLYRRWGEYKYVNYAHTMLNIPYKRFYSNQIDLYHKIKELFVNREKNNVICLLSGEVGTGKSFFSYLFSAGVKRLHLFHVQSNRTRWYIPFTLRWSQSNQSQTSSDRIWRGRYRIKRDP